MDGHLGPVSTFEARLASVLPAIVGRAAQRDATGDFPLEEVEALRAIGALAAPLPRAFGGEGLGTEPHAAASLFATLRAIGSASLPLGRLYEGHVNALRLVMRRGDAAQRDGAADDALAGHLFGVWNTEPADRPLRLAAGLLHGDKTFASGAGDVTRPLVTATSESGERLMLLVPLDRGERADLSAWAPHGMRASASGRVSFDGLAVGAESIIGGPGDYLAPPDFRAGAWRAAAVAMGGLDALVVLLRDGLRARRRDGAPAQRARLAEAFIAQETARLWLQRTAAIAEDDSGDPEMAVAYVGLARRAVEAACLDVMRIAQRAIGLAAFMTGDAVERVCRDLATYLRQPALDEALDEAAAWFTLHGLPDR